MVMVPIFYWNSLTRWPNMLGAYYPGQSYPGRTNKTIFGVYIIVESTTHSHTASELTLIQDYALQLSDAIHSHIADTLGLIGDIIAIDSYISHSADTITLGIVVRPKPKATNIEIKKAMSYIENNKPLIDIKKFTAHAPSSIVIKPVTVMESKIPKGLNVKP